MEVTDLYKPLKEHTSNLLGEKITSVWEEEFKRLNKSQLPGTQKQANEKGKNESKESNFKEPSLMRVLIKCFGLKVAMYGVFLAIMEILLR